MKKIKTFNSFNENVLTPEFEIGEYVRLDFTSKEMGDLYKMSPAIKNNFSRDKFIFQVIDFDPKATEPYTIKNVFTDKIEHTSGECFYPVEEYEVDAIKYNL